MVSDFFFQAEDGIRGGTVTGVQTCALPICCYQQKMVQRVCLARRVERDKHVVPFFADNSLDRPTVYHGRPVTVAARSEERRVGKEWRVRRSAEPLMKTAMMIGGCRSREKKE